MNMHKALHPKDDVDRLYVLRKREEEYFPALKTTFMHRYNDLKNAKKSAGKDWLQSTEAILTTRRPTEQQLQENKNGKKNNSIDVLND